MFREGYDLRDATIQACREAGFEPTFAVDGGEMDAVLSFVEAGLGIALVPGIVVARRPGIRVTRLAPPGVRRTIAVARRRDVVPTHAGRELRRILLDYVATRRRREPDRREPAPGAVGAAAGVQRQVGQRPSASSIAR